MKTEEIYKALREKGEALSTLREEIDFITQDDGLTDEEKAKELDHRLRDATGLIAVMRDQVYAIRKAARS